MSDFGIDTQKKTGETIELTDGSKLELTTAKTTAELLKEVKERIKAEQALLEADEEFLKVNRFSTKDFLDIGTTSDILKHHDNIIELTAREAELVTKLRKEEEKKAEIKEKGQKTATGDQIKELASLQKILDDSVPIADKIAAQVKSIEEMRDVVDKDGNLFFTDDEIDRMKEL